MKLGHFDFYFKTFISNLNTHRVKVNDVNKKKGAKRRTMLISGRASNVNPRCSPKRPVMS